MKFRGKNKNFQSAIAIELNICFKALLMFPILYPVFGVCALELLLPMGVKLG